MPALLALLDGAFPGLGERATWSAACGYRWSDVSAPTLILDGDGPITHIGLLDIPVVIDDQPALVGGVHAVCTRPDRRKQGYFRQAMTDLLERIDGRYHALVLFTDEPGIYTRFGFRVEPEYATTFDLNARGTPGRIKRFDVMEAGGPARLISMFTGRTPVSNRYGIGPEVPISLFRSPGLSLYRCESLDVLFDMTIDDSTAHLFDVVGSRIPSLDEIAGVLPDTIRSVVCYFLPDRLGHPNSSSAPAEVSLIEAAGTERLGGDRLMVRGTLPDRIVHPRTGRC